MDATAQRERQLVLKEMLLEIGCKELEVKFSASELHLTTMSGDVIALNMKEIWRQTRLKKKSLDWFITRAGEVVHFTEQWLKDPVLDEFVASYPVDA